VLEVSCLFAHVAKADEDLLSLYIGLCCTLMAYCQSTKCSWSLCQLKSSQAWT